MPLKDAALVESHGVTSKEFQGMATIARTRRPLRKNSAPSRLEIGPRSLTIKAAMRAGEMRGRPRIEGIEAIRRRRGTGTAARSPGHGKNP